MSKALEPVNVGTITPLQRIRSLNIQTTWDETVSPAQTRVSATFVYEIIYPDEQGQQLCPPKPDGYVTLDDAACRAQPDFQMIYDALAAIGHAARDAQLPSVPPPLGSGEDMASDQGILL